MSVKLLSTKDGTSISKTKKSETKRSIPTTTTTHNTGSTELTLSSNSEASSVINYSSCSSNTTITTKTGADGSKASTKYTPGESSSTTNHSAAPDKALSVNGNSKSTKKTNSVPSLTSEINVHAENTTGGSVSYSGCGSPTTSSSKSSGTTYYSCGTGNSTANSSITYSSCGSSTYKGNNSSSFSSSYTSCSITSYSSCGTYYSITGSSNVTSSPSSYVEQIFIIEDSSSKASPAYTTSSSAKYQLSGSAHGASYYIVKDEITNHAKETGWYIDFTFLLENHRYRLSDITLDDLEDSIEYIENPYEPGEFFKKTTSIKMSGAKGAQDSYVSIETPYLSTTNLSMNDIVSKFISINRYEDDGMVKLRGSVVNENIFSAKRKTVLIDTIRKFFLNNTSIVDINEAFNSSEALVSIYNFAKAAIELVSQEEENTLEFNFPYRDLKDIKYFTYKLGLITWPVEPTIGKNDISSKERFTAPRRSIIEKLVSVDKYSLNSEFIKSYGLKVREDKTLESARTTVPNPNGFILQNVRAELDNTNSYNAYNMFVSNVTANALRQFVSTKRGVFLDTHADNSVIEKSVKVNSREESDGYVREDEKKIYTSAIVKPLGKDLAYTSVSEAFSPTMVYYTKTPQNKYVFANISAFAQGTQYYAKEHYSVENILDEILIKRNGSSDIVMKSFI